MSVTILAQDHNACPGGSFTLALLPWMSGPSTATLRLSRRLEALERVARGLVEEIHAIREELLQVQDEADWEEIEAAEPEPAPATGPQVSGVRNRFYTVLVARPAAEDGSVPAGEIGLYNRYGSYINQVCRADSYPHVGRGHCHFDRETESRAFPTLSAAERYWNLRYPDRTATRHW